MNLNSFATELLGQVDPIDLLFQALNQIWTCDGSGDLDAFYGQQERETNHLEEFIRDTYFELYETLLERARSQDRGNPVCIPGSLHRCPGWSLH